MSQPSINESEEISSSNLNVIDAASILNPDINPEAAKSFSDPINVEGEGTKAHPVSFKDFNGKDLKIDSEIAAVRLLVDETIRNPGATLWLNVRLDFHRFFNAQLFEGNIFAEINDMQGIDLGQYGVMDQAYLIDSLTAYRKMLRGEQIDGKYQGLYESKKGLEQMENYAAKSSNKDGAEN